MTERIPRNFLQGEAAAIASYDYYDLAEGTGIKTFYGADFSLSGAVANALLTETIPAVDGEEKPPGGATTEFNFDLPAFALPKTIAASKAHFQCFIRNETGSGSYYLQIQLKKISGAVITNITEKIDSIVCTSGFKFISFDLDCTQTHFKKGDILRLVVAGVVPAGKDCHFTCEPTGRDTAHFTSAGGAFDTTLRLLVPFKIDR